MKDTAIPLPKNSGIDTFKKHRYFCFAIQKCRPMYLYERNIEPNVKYFAIKLEKNTSIAMNTYIIVCITIYMRLNQKQYMYYYSLYFNFWYTFISLNIPKVTTSIIYNWRACTNTTNIK